MQTSTCCVVNVRASPTAFCQLRHGTFLRRPHPAGRWPDSDRQRRTLNGAMFSTFASFWLLLAAYLAWFTKAVPIDQRGQATALLF